ncbi:MAG: hypothetical protein ABF679_08470 [Lentilactobacillus diolivorans]
MRHYDPFYASAPTNQIAKEMLGMLLTYDSPKGLVGCKRHP